MNNILFSCYGLGIGGIEKCLVNLVNALPEEKFNIDVLLMNPDYTLKDSITRGVNYIDRFGYVMNTTDTLGEIKANGGIIKHPVLFAKYCLFRLRVKLNILPWRSFKSLPKQYDVAVAYSQNDYSPYYVIDRVKAKRKILWYHNGAYEKRGKAYAQDLKYYSQFDNIVAVSSDCAKVLKEKFESVSGKILVLRNICDVEYIKSQAEKFIPDSYQQDGIHITTVGRLTTEKGANLAVEVCKDLCNSGLNVFWHWVGDGNQRDIIEELIRSKKLTERFLLEGNQNNPYPFIKNTDIYVQPSYYEAYSTTVTEAKVLQKPIVTTDVGGMRDQIEDGVNGFIVPINSEDLYRRIKAIVEDVVVVNELISKLETNNIDNNASLQNYYETVFK